MRKGNIIRHRTTHASQPTLSNSPSPGWQWQTSHEPQSSAAISAYKRAHKFDLAGGDRQVAERKSFRTTPIIPSFWDLRLRALSIPACSWSDGLMASVICPPPSLSYNRVSLRFPCFIAAETPRLGLRTGVVRFRSLLIAVRFTFSLSRRVITEVEFFGCSAELNREIGCYWGVYLIMYNFAAQWKFNLWESDQLRWFWWDNFVMFRDIMMNKIIFYHINGTWKCKDKC